MKERISYKLRKVPEEWVNTRGFGATVMVCDTGADSSHEAIRKNIVQYKSFTPAHAQVVKSPHGTHVCGTIVGNDNEITGISPMSGLFIAQCLSSGRGSMNILESALKWAEEIVPDVLNLSIAYKPRHKRIERLLKSISENGTIICAAQTPYPSKYPACYEEVISVGSFDCITRDGPDIEARCPRTIYSAAPMNNYREMSGHSMSCAFMSGVCCLARAYNKEITKEEILETLRDQPVSKLAPKSCYKVGIFTD